MRRFWRVGWRDDVAWLCHGSSHMQLSLQFLESETAYLSCCFGVKVCPGTDFTSNNGLCNSFYFCQPCGQFINLNKSVTGDTFLLMKKNIHSNAEKAHGRRYVNQVIQILKKQYPGATIALDFGDTFQLLVAVILSAQCTDIRVNKVTPGLFKRFPQVEDFVGCDVRELERLIYSTGFYKNKAKNIKAAAEKIVSEFGGEVPERMEDLLKLPGVARKTANVVLSAGFGRSEGVVVDTHVARICGLLGLVPQKMSEAKNAVKIEQILMKMVPRKEWGGFSYLMINHGRGVCVARRPRCEICVLKEICPSAFASRHGERDRP